MQKTCVQKQNGKAKGQLPDPNYWTNFRVRVLIFGVSMFSLRSDIRKQLGNLCLGIPLLSRYLEEETGKISRDPLNQSFQTLPWSLEKLTSEVSGRVLVPEHFSFYLFYVVMLPLTFCLG